MMKAIYIKYNEQEIKKFETMKSDLYQLGKDLIDCELPAPSDDRLEKAESQAIKTVIYLLNDCIDALKNEISDMKNDDEIK